MGCDGSKPLWRGLHLPIDQYTFHGQGRTPWRGVFSNRPISDMKTKVPGIDPPVEPLHAASPDSAAAGEHRTSKAPNNDEAALEVLLTLRRRLLDRLAVTVVDQRA